jgi:spore coat polysaccharide biosynthesis protein SpsF
MVDFLCIIQARLNSSRLPAKVMMNLGGVTLLQRVYETVSKSRSIDKIVIATSDQVSDNIIAQHSKKMDVTCFRGSLNNVLKRFYDASKLYNAKNIVRITADNPLMDAELIDSLIDHFKSSSPGGDYSMFNNGVYGLSAEVFSFSVLKNAFNNTDSDPDKEHVTPYIRNNFIVNNIDIHSPYNRPELSATIDTIEDYKRMESFYLFCEDRNYEQNIDNYILYLDKAKDIEFSTRY